MTDAHAKAFRTELRAQARFRDRQPVKLAVRRPTDTINQKRRAEFEAKWRDHPAKQQLGAV